jgi:hypothetical protein
VRRSIGTLAAFLAFCSRVPEASAQPAAVVESPLEEIIDLAAGATCLDEHRLASQVAGWLARDRVRSDIHVHVSGDERDPHAADFRISHRGTSHVRHFDHLPDVCDDATAVVGLAIALAIDANALSDLIAPPPEAARTQRWVSVEGAVGLQVLPGGSVGGAVGFEYGVLDWLSARTDVLAQFSWANAIVGTSGVFDASVGAVFPQICAGGGVATKFRIELCSGAAIGALHAQGHRYAVESTSGTGPWIVASAGLRLLFEAGIPWVLDVNGVFSLYEPTFRAGSGSGAEVLRPPNPAGAMLSAGPVFSF